MIEVCAPGKVVLLGEYAVLDGAPALVAAVDRGVRCAVAPGGSGVRIDAPDARFVGPALSHVDAPPGHYRFTAWNAPQTATKAGLGSSAAAVVAAVVAAREASGQPHRPTQVWRDARAVHHAVQGGGSGIDVAASTFGGITRFRGGHVTAERIGDLPDRLSVVWSGQSAATGPRVQRYLAWDDPARERFVAWSTAIVDSWRDDPIAALADAARLLAEIDARAGLGWWCDAYAPVLQLARARGGAAKPSGAGGGDILVALFPDRDRKASFEAACLAQGATPLGVALADGAHRVHYTNEGAP